MFGSYILSIAITLPDISEYLEKLRDIIIKSGHSFFAIKAAEGSKRLNHHKSWDRPGIPERTPYFLAS